MKCRGTAGCGRRITFRPWWLIPIRTRRRVLARHLIEFHEGVTWHSFLEAFP